MFSSFQFLEGHLGQITLMIGDTDTPNCYNVFYLGWGICIADDSCLDYNGLYHWSVCDCKCCTAWFGKMSMNCFLMHVYNIRSVAITSQYSIQVLDPNS